MQSTIYSWWQRLDIFILLQIPKLEKGGGGGAGFVKS